MENNNLYRATPQIVLGLIVITVGVLFTLENMDILYARDYLRYWPALVVLFGISKMVQPRNTPGRLFGVVLTLFGLLLLLDKLPVFGFRLWDFWPLIIVFFGLSLIWRSFGRRSAYDRRGMVEQQDDSSKILTGIAFMSGFKRNISSRDFRGGELTAIMGGCEIDLRQAAMADGEAVLDVFAFWGGIELKVPLEWSVVVEATPLLGGFDDQTRPPQGGSAKRLIIRGYAIMGGVEILN
jgi:predicted membrane protein